MPGGNAPKKSDDVVYIGGATTRRITAAQWEKAGVKDQETITWSKSLNRNRCKVGDLSSDALDLLITHMPREFVVANDGEKAKLPVDQPSPDLNEPGDGANMPAPNGR